MRCRKMFVLDFFEMRGTAAHVCTDCGAPGRWGLSTARGEGGARRGRDLGRQDAAEPQREAGGMDSPSAARAGDMVTGVAGSSPVAAPKFSVKQGGRPIRGSKERRKFPRNVKKVGK